MPTANSNVYRIVGGKKVFVRKFRPVTRRKLRPATKGAIASVVKKVIASTDEKKREVLIQSPTTFNGGISATSEWYNPIPIIGQGDGAFQRQGNVIKPSMLDMTWHISLGTGVTRSCDDTVVLYLFKVKNLRSYADMISRGSPNSFLNKGSLGLSPFTGVLGDVATPVNTDGFTIISKRVFKLTKGPGGLNNDAGTYSAAGGITSKRINIKMKDLPQFHYQQGNSDGLPENYGLVWALGYAKSDGSAPDVLFQDVRVDFVSTLYYTDA